MKTVTPTKTPIEMKAEAANLNLQKSKIEVGEQLIFNRPNCLIICTITEVREKAIKVDYAVDPISFTGRFAVVYERSCFIPKSCIINDQYGALTVKKWFENKFQGGYKTKAYMLIDGKQVFVK